MKLNVTRYLVPAALLTLAVAGDILVQRFEVVSEWDFLDVAFRAARFGLFFGAGAFLFGRRAQWAYVPLWCLFCGVLAIECVARFNFGMVLGGLDEVDVIASVPTDSNDKPRTEQVIQKYWPNARSAT